MGRRLRARGKSRLKGPQKRSDGEDRGATRLRLGELGRGLIESRERTNRPSKKVWRRNWGDLESEQWEEAEGSGRGGLGRCSGETRCRSLGEGKLFLECGTQSQGSAQSPYPEPAEVGVDLEPAGWRRQPPQPPDLLAPAVAGALQPAADSFQALEASVPASWGSPRPRQGRPSQGPPPRPPTVARSWSLVSSGSGNCWPPRRKSCF